jgi:hypothetical protein
VAAARVQSLAKKYKSAWGAPLRGRKGPLRGRECFFHFKRGFPDSAHAPAERLIAEGDTLFRLAPITYVDAKDVTPENIGPLLACPWLANARSLTLNGSYKDGPRPEWEVLADCPHLKNLTYLWLYRGRLSRAGGARLAAANPFPRLRQYQMSESELGDAGLAGLLDGPAFGQLEEVYLHRCGVETGGAEVLGNSPGLAGITKLSLPNQPLPVEAVRAVTAGRFWPNLRELVLWSCELGDEGAAALDAAGPTQLRVLKLSGNQIAPLGLRTLAAGPILRTVEVLDLGSNFIWDSGARTLAAAPHLGNLRRLHLGCCGIGPAGAKALASCPSLSGLRWLTLHSNSILADGALALADSPHLGNLEYLSLSNIRGKARQRLMERFGDAVRF